MASARRFRAAFVALIPLGGMAVTALLHCGGNVDPTVTTEAQALAATTRPAAQAVIAKPGGAASQLAAANHFDLDGGEVRISYSESAGVPVVTYQDALLTRTFRGPEVEIDATPAGTMVTVVTRLTIDSGSTTFSVLVPRVRVGAGSTPVQTQGITAVHQFSIVESNDPGQLDDYTFTPLHGAGSRLPVELTPSGAGVTEGAKPVVYAPPNN